VFKGQRIEVEGLEDNSLLQFNPEPLVGADRRNAVACVPDGFFCNLLRDLLRDGWHKARGRKEAEVACDPHAEPETIEEDVPAFRTEPVVVHPACGAIAEGILRRPWSGRAFSVCRTINEPGFSHMGPCCRGGIPGCAYLPHDERAAEARRGAEREASSQIQPFHRVALLRMARHVPFFTFKQ